MIDAYIVHYYQGVFMSRIKRVVAASILAGGLASVSAPFSAAVVDGVPAEPGVDTRSIVGIQTPGPEGTRFVDNCTGTVIAPEWILTADHCARNGESIDQLAVTATGTTYGNATLRVEDNSVRRITRQVFDGVQVFRPDDGSDIVLMKLPRAIAGVAPAVIADSSHSVGTEGKAYGWGIPADKDHVPGEKLSYAPSMVRFNGLPKDFQAELGAEFGEFEKYSRGKYYYTTQKAPGQVVQGDSGGPLMVDGVVVGVASQIVKDKGGSKSTVGVLTTDVAPHVGWIQDTIGNSKPSEFIDVAAGVGGVDSEGRKVLPFTVVNLGSEDVDEVNVEVSPPDGSAFPVGAELVMSDSKYAAGESAEFVSGKSLPIDMYTPGADASRVDRSFTVRVPVGLKSGEGVQLRVVLPEAVEGKYQVLAYVAPGVRSSLFDLDGTQGCGVGADLDSCVSVAFSSGDVKDVAVGKSVLNTGVRLESAGASSPGEEAEPSSVVTSTSAPATSVTTSPEESDVAPATSPNKSSGVTTSPGKSSVVTTSPGKSSGVTATRDNVTSEPTVSEVGPSSGEDSGSSGGASEEGGSREDVPSVSVTSGSSEPSAEGDVAIPGDVVLEGGPDSRPSGNIGPSTDVAGSGRVDGREESDEVGSDVSADVMVGADSSTEDETVVAEHPAASQRILADTGVAGLLGVVGVGLGVVLGGVFVLRRRG